MTKSIQAASYTQVPTAEPAGLPTERTTPRHDLSAEAADSAGQLQAVHANCQVSARNLLLYLALGRHDRTGPAPAHHPAAPLVVVGRARLPLIFHVSPITCPRFSAPAPAWLFPKPNG